MFDMFIIIFVFVQLVNVILSTFKSVLTIRGSNLTAAIINSISYSINIIIVYLVSREVNLVWSISVTASTNFVGVWLGKYILEKLRKEQLWRISASVKTAKSKDFKKALYDKGIKFISYNMAWDKYDVVDIFSESKSESKIIKDIIRAFEAKYTISENRGDL